MTTTRLLCVQTPANPINTTPGVPPNLASYVTGTQGSVIDVPGDASGGPVQALLHHVEGYSSGNSLPASGPCFLPLAESGPSSARPAFPSRGQAFVDSSIGKMIWWDGSAWRDVTGTSV